jgi:hypothetical protein
MIEKAMNSNHEYQKHMLSTYDPVFALKYGILRIEPQPLSYVPSNERIRELLGPNAEDPQFCDPGYF